MEIEKKVLTDELDPYLFAGDTCLTTTPDSRDPGAKCVFPFTYKGVKYEGCPPDLKDPSRNWCSTKTDLGRDHLFTSLACWHGCMKYGFFKQPIDQSK